MTNCKYLSILLLTVAILGCKNTKKEEAQNSHQEEILTAGDSPIRKITILYYNYPVDNSELIGCDHLKLSLPTFGSSDYHGILDATIDNRKVLDEVKQQLMPLRPTTDASVVNVVLTSTIEYDNGAKDQLCIGGQEGSTLFLNGIPQENNNRLLYLIKNNAGYYPWMIGDALFEMPELRDNSFMKEPFVSSPYYKQWQNNRNSDN